MCSTRRWLDRHGGERLWIALDVNGRVLQPIVNLTGSEWRRCRIGVIWWFEGVLVMMRWKVCRPGDQVRLIGKIMSWRGWHPRPWPKLLNGKRSRQFWRVLTCRLEGCNRVNWWSRDGCYCIAVEIDSFLQFFDTVKRVFKSHCSTSDWPRTTLFVNLEWGIGKIYSYILQHFFHPCPCALFLSFVYQWNICLLIALDHYLLLSLVTC